jgi:hypothetical protein
MWPQSQIFGNTQRLQVQLGGSFVVTVDLRQRSEHTSRVYLSPPVTQFGEQRNGLLTVLLGSRQIATHE